MRLLNLSPIQTMLLLQSNSRPPGKAVPAGATRKELTMVWAGPAVATDATRQADKRIALMVLLSWMGGMCGASRERGPQGEGRGGIIMVGILGCNGKDMWRSIV